MKKIMKLWFAAMMAVVIGMMPSCTKEYLDDVPELPDLPRVSNLNYVVDGYDIILSWTLPVTDLTISEVVVTRNNASGQPAQTWRLEPTATTLTVEGNPMGEDTGYTVKVKYDEGKYSSTGETIYVLLPDMNFPPVTNLQATVEKRNVRLTWTLPQHPDFQGIRIYRSDNPDNVVELEPTATEYVMVGQPMDQELVYNVEGVYATYYASATAKATATIPYRPIYTGFLLLSDVSDDDELAAITWFSNQPDTKFVTPEELPDLDPDDVTVLWIMVDRIGLGAGWQNLPAPLNQQATIDALKAYWQGGGSLYLSNMATQLTDPIGIVPSGMGPNIFSSGDGGPGDDVWVINPHLGWDFRNGSEDGQGYYNRTSAPIFDGITLEDPNNYGYSNLPLIGPGQREDHNCMWDLNANPPFGRGDQADVIKNFEVTTGSIVYATWGHVRDHCVAGLVEFLGSQEHGRCIANGFAAYEFNQNSGTNPYQANVEKLTSNILNYLK